MMYSFDVYKRIDKDKSKKVATHSYPTFVQAQNARRAIENFPKGKHLLQPREHAPFVFKELGGWTCSSIRTES